MTGRIVVCRTLASIRTTTSPPRCSRPRIGGFSFASVPRPGAPLSRRRLRGALFGDGRRVALVPGHDIDLVDLDLAVEDDGRGSGGKPLPQLLGHRLHVRGAKLELLGDLPVREVEAHEVEAQNPDPQLLMVSGENGPGQVVEAAAAGRAAITLAVRLGIIPAMTGDRGALTVRAADAVGPAVLAHQLVAFRIVDQRRQVHQRRHERHQCRRADPHSTVHRPDRYPWADHPETRQEPQLFPCTPWLTPRWRASRTRESS